MDMFYAVDTPEFISRITNKRLSLSHDKVSASVQCIVEFGLSGNSSCKHLVGDLCLWGIGGVEIVD